MSFAYGGPPGTGDSFRKMGSPPGRLLTLSDFADPYVGMPLIVNIPFAFEHLAVAAVTTDVAGRPAVQPSCRGGKADTAGWSKSTGPSFAAPPGVPRSLKNSTLIARKVLHSGRTSSS